MEILMSFEDCPYHCNNGKLFDRNSRKEVPCPYCSKKRRELEKAGLMKTEKEDPVSISEALGIDCAYIKPVFNYDAVIPEVERAYLNEDIYKIQKEKMEELYNGLLIGKLPNHSMCFGLGVKGKVDLVAYPMLVKAYISGISVARFVDCNEYARKTYQMDFDFVDSLLSKDFAMMLIPEGSSSVGISAAKGFMQERALKGKPTVFLTTWSVEACSAFLGFYGDKSLFMASAYFIKYETHGDSRHSRYINHLTGVKNKKIEGPTGYPGDDILDASSFGFETKKEPPKTVMAELSMIAGS